MAVAVARDRRPDRLLRLGATTSAGSPSYTVPRADDERPSGRRSHDPDRRRGRPAAQPVASRLGLLPRSGTRRASGSATPCGSCRRTRLVHVTIYNFDGASGLRNPFLAPATGARRARMIVDGKPLDVMPPDDRRTPSPFPRSACSSRSLRSPTTRRTRAATRRARCRRPPHDHVHLPAPARPGHYRWQCFVPCAAGLLYGFGGPMQTIGYMDGFLDVV